MLKTRGQQSAECDSFATKIWLWCTERDIWLSVCHTSGSACVDADTESNQINSSTEWSFNLDVFSDLHKLWGPFEIDLFASRFILQLFWITRDLYCQNCFMVLLFPKRSAKMMNSSVKCNHFVWCPRKKSKDVFDIAGRALPKTAVRFLVLCHGKQTLVLNMSMPFSSVGRNTNNRY